MLTTIRHLDVRRLVAWLSSRQYAPEGGFSGRTNKLVDGCYSHWVGACFPLIEAALNGSSDATSVSESLFHREGLIRYILCCGQDQTKRGGLRDKPGKYVTFFSTRFHSKFPLSNTNSPARMSDAYHSCYVLSGLSSAQHQWRLADPEQDMLPNGTTPAWAVYSYPEDTQIFDQGDKISTSHPVYAIPQQKQEAIAAYFRAKEGF